MKKKKQKSQYQYKALKVNGKRIDEHRFVAIQHWGEDAVRGMDVHHKNGNKLDNRIENLELLPRSEHVSKHFKGKPLSEHHIKKTKQGLKAYYSVHLSKTAKPVVMMTLDGVPIVVFDSVLTTQYYGFSNVPVRRACKGELKTYRNFRWRLLRPNESLVVPVLHKVPYQADLKRAQNLVSKKCPSV